MNKENIPSYKSDTVRIPIFFLLAFIFYAVGIVVFISKGDNKTVGAFEAVTGVSGLILSFATIFYVAKAYGQQKRQNDIQSLQIETQKKQIEDNKKDVEFNRIIDVLYNHMGHTKSLLNPYAEIINSKKLYSINHKNLQPLLNNIDVVRNSIKTFNEEIKFYSELIDKRNLDLETKIFIFKMFFAQINPIFKNYIISLLIIKTHFDVNSTPYNLEEELIRLQIEDHRGFMFPETGFDESGNFNDIPKLQIEIENEKIYSEYGSSIDYNKGRSREIKCLLNEIAEILTYFKVEWDYGYVLP